MLSKFFIAVLMALLSLVLAAPAHHDDPAIVTYMRDGFVNALSRDEVGILIIPSFNTRPLSGDGARVSLIAAQFRDNATCQACKIRHGVAYALIQLFAYALKPDWNPSNETIWPDDFNIETRSIQCEAPFHQDVKQTFNITLPALPTDDPRLVAPTLDLTPGHTCTHFLERKNRNYDHLHLWYGGELSFDVPEEIRKFDALLKVRRTPLGEAHDAGRCRSVEGKGVSCWVPKSGKEAW
ncbi:uncharacterized protein KY384_006251 [Bacidia gigantensis]|uniref:uncharacterized protein n=1 Tax=Bacidia gigantensis TaxID=2732470 RepID=UPI001D03D2A7|nr:uncharacterized protein KY384_006251 [Bacidia gigantensis]KAG8529614.1 hypothetical protein KY384_006251 [Bacidia gigantensis]